MPKKRQRISKPTGPSLVTYSEIASNDYSECVRVYFSEMSRGSNAINKIWKTNPTLLMTFVDTLVVWKNDGLWDPKSTSQSNWIHLADIVNKACNVELTCSQYQFKYYRLMKVWKLYDALSGKTKSTAETGLGWDHERLCFLASAERWAELIQENSRYSKFSGGQSCAIYITLSQIFKGRTATGSHAFSSASPFEPPNVCEPRPCHRGSFSSKGKGKGKGKVPATSFSVDDDVYIPQFDDPTAFTSPHTQTQPKKGVASTPADSSHGGSRGSKSSRSSDGLQEALTNFSRFSSKRLEEKESNDKYSAMACSVVLHEHNQERTIPNENMLACMKELKFAVMRTFFINSACTFQRWWIDTILGTLSPPPLPPQIILLSSCVSFHFSN